MSDRMDKEEEVEKHDLWGVRHVAKKLVVIQPAKTVGRQLGYQDFFEIFSAVMNLENLVHSSSLAFDFHYGPYGIESCGGNLEVAPIGEAKIEQWMRDQIKDDDMLALVCDRCNLQARIYFKTQIKNCILQLMLKQIIPSLKGFHYIDCAAWEPSIDALMSKEEADEIKNLGVMSVIPQGLWGLHRRFEMSSGGRHFDLGFMAEEGMNTTIGFGGYDLWARFLIERKFEQLEKFFKLDALSTLLGPRDPFHNQK